MARLPQFGAFLGTGGPAEIVTAVLPGDRLYRIDLLCNTGIAAMKLEEQSWRYFVIQFRIFVNGIDLGFIEQFDSRHRDAALDRLDDGIDGVGDRGKGAYRRRDRFRDRSEEHTSELQSQSKL